MRKAGVNRRANARERLALKNPPDRELILSSSEVEAGRRMLQR